MTSTKRSYFEAMYESDPDPWGFESRHYEQRKYAITMASLPKARYRSAYEPGCSIGVLSEMLAQRCDRLLATDIIPTAIDAARRRLSERDHVRLELRSIPDEWPDEEFDLIVLSEIAYYFDESDLWQILALVLHSTRPGAHVVGVHWRGVTDYPLSGDQAHHIIEAVPELRPIVRHEEGEFVLNVWEHISRGPPPEHRCATSGSWYRSTTKRSSCRRPCAPSMSPFPRCLRRSNAGSWWYSTPAPMTALASRQRGAPAGTRCMSCKDTARMSGQPVVPVAMSSWAHGDVPISDTPGSPQRMPIPKYHMTGSRHRSRPAPRVPICGPDGLKSRIGWTTNPKRRAPGQPPTRQRTIQCTDRTWA